MQQDKTDLFKLPKKVLIARLAQNKPYSELGKVCSFIPIKSSQEKCKDSVKISFGDFSYCKKHAGTIQATKAKQEYEKMLESKKVSKIDKSQNNKKKSRVTIKRVVPNYWGRFEEPESHIVFNPKTREAYGYQEQNGKVRPLSQNDIRVCEKNGWLIKKQYISPSGSSTSSNSTSSNSTSSNSSTNSSSGSIATSESDEDTITSSVSGSSRSDSSSDVERKISEEEDFTSESNDSNSEKSKDNEESDESNEEDHSTVEDSEDLDLSNNSGEISDSEADDSSEASDSEASDSEASDSEASDSEASDST